MSRVAQLTHAAHGSMDEYFIENYLAHNDKAKAYTYAKRMLGEDFNEEYAKQYGYVLFKRLSDVISEQLDRMEVEDEALSRNVLRAIAGDDQESGSTRVAAAKELKRKRVERPAVKKAKDVAELDKEIAKMQKQLEEIK